MAKKKSMFRGELFRTDECVISYAFGLFKSRTKTSDDGSTRESWDSTLIFPLSYKPKLEAELAKVIVGEWGEKGLEMAKNGLIKSPILAGDGKEARDKESGEIHPGLGPDKIFIRVQSNKPPVVRFKDPNIPAAEAEVYSGSRGFGVINGFAWYNAKNGNGVSFGIEYYQKTGEGDRIGGSDSVNPNDWFETVDDEGSAPSETTTGAGAGGLFG